MAISDLWEIGWVLAGDSRFHVGFPQRILRLSARAKVEIGITYLQGRKVVLIEGFEVCQERIWFGTPEVHDEREIEKWTTRTSSMP